MDVTPTCAVLGAFSEVLAGWSTSRKLTLNLTMLHRLPLHPEVNDIAGDFTSMVLLGLDLDLGSTFRERIAHAQRQLLADMDHMSLSGPEILQQISSITGARGGGAFPVVFSSFLNNAMDGGSLAQLGAPAYVITNTPQLTFDHQVFQEDGQLVLIWDCVDGTYPEGMLDDMIVAYRALLEQMAHSDEVWNQERLSLVPRAHLDLFERVNRTEAPTSDKRLHELFLDQVARRGSAAAVVTRTTTLTYDELERSSAVLARILRDMGAGPGQLVAVVMEKGWEQVVGSLAVMRSGAAYVPIDPALPAERVRYLLEDGAVAVALVQPHLRDAIAWPEGVSVVAVSGSLHGAAGTDSAPIDQVQRLEDLAYVIYTSGSTGRPKGVMIEHRNAVNTIVAINQRFAVGPNDRVLALSALNFDLSVYDLFGTLAAGGTIVMPDVATTRDPEALSALVAEQGVTLWSSVPALVELWIEHARKAAPPAKLAVRLVMMSGDWIPVALPDKIRELLPDVALSSLGGATEPAIWSVAYPIGEVDPAWKSIPYGGPLPNQTVCVLDDRLMPRPVWVPGEIYFGGLGVGRGYWHDDERTRAAFIVHPRTQERLYRSGDLGRYLPDGNLEILGRVDFQVKIRGYRIELGEIEAALVQHPAVSAAVATVYGETSAQQRLVAYAVPRERRHLETGAAVTSESRALLEFKLAGTGLRGDLAGQAALAFDGQASLENLPPRRSIRRFERTEVSASSLERLLGSLRGIAVPGAPLPTYRYPSAGSTYAVQTYLYAGAGRVQRLAEGIYYYHPERHELLRVSDGSIDRAAFAAVNHRLFDDSAFTLFLVGQPKAVEPLYGALTDRFLLLEAGYMSQLLMTEAPAAGLGLCPIGDLRFAAVAPQFALDGAQPCLHALCGGAVAQDAYTHAVSYDEPDALRDDSLVDELKRALRQKLPDYMVPATIVVLEALPLTANGKVDRKRLPEPGGADRVGATTEFTPPTGDLEQRLGALVCEILRLPRVSVHDNWFELGGTSMSLVRLYQRLGEVSATEIAIVEMFAHPTVASLAKRLADGTASAAAGRSAERGRSRAELRRSLSGQGRLKT
jgi:epothilone synthetase B